MTDNTFRLPSVCRTSRIRVSEKNVELINEFFRSVAKRGGMSKVSVFTETVPYGGSVSNNWSEKSPSDLAVEVGMYFKYIHRIGVSERIVIEKENDNARIQSVYAISG